MVIFPIEMEIDGVIVRTPKVCGTKRQPNKIWSKNTGRTASQKMVGTILAIKDTYSIEWPPLTQEEQEIIESLVSNKSKPFVVVKIRRPNGDIWQKEVYFGAPSFTEWDWINGQWMSTDNKVDAIER